MKKQKKPKSGLDAVLRDVFPGARKDEREERLRGLYREEHALEYGRPDLLDDDDRAEIEERANDEIEAWRKCGFREDQRRALSERLREWWANRISDQNREHGQRGGKKSGLNRREAAASRKKAAA